MSIDDYKWTQDLSLQIGIWVDNIIINSGESALLKVALRNISTHVLEYYNDFGVAIKTGESVIEDFNGPRSSESILLHPGAFEEVRYWKLNVESGLSAGDNECWVIYRSKDGSDMISEIIKIRMTAD